MNTDSGQRRIYLDTCVFNRPFDDQEQSQILLETVSFISVLRMVEESKVSLVSSAVLQYENGRNPSTIRREWVDACLRWARFHQDVNEDVRNRARQREQHGLKPVDALHAACAEDAGCEFLLTCDDGFIKRYAGPLRVMSPVDFIIHVQGVWI